MIDSVEVFDAVVNSRWFIRSTVVLFLNKTDIFKDKVGRVPIKNTFKDYNGALFSAFIFS
jgi:guanine nucleotide-binding protein subunit alpha